MPDGRPEFTVPSPTASVTVEAWPRSASRSSSSVSPGGPGGLPRDRAARQHRARPGGAGRASHPPSRPTRCSAPPSRSRASTGPGATSAARSRAPGAASAAGVLKATGHDCRGQPGAAGRRRPADQIALLVDGLAGTERARGGPARRRTPGRCPDDARPRPVLDRWAAALASPTACTSWSTGRTTGPRPCGGVRPHGRVRHRLAVGGRPRDPADAARRARSGRAPHECSARCDSWIDQLSHSEYDVRGDVTTCCPACRLSPRRWPEPRISAAARRLRRRCVR